MGTNTHIHPSNNGGSTNNEAKVQDNVLKILPPGYKFCPSDVELIEYYLKRKIAGDPSIIHGRIHDVDVYKHSPDQLDEMYKYQGEQHAYFFTRRSKKYANGSRPDRAAGNYGFWKASGKEIDVTNNNIVIGSKRTLVFFRGKSRGAVLKTNWIMQEFTINNLAISNSANPSYRVHFDDWVLCKIYEHKREKKSQNTISITINQEATTTSANLVATPEYQYNYQHFHAQHMQPTLSRNEVDTSHVQPNYQYSQTQHMQDSLSMNEVATSFCQPDQLMEILSTNIFATPHYQPSYHQCSQAQHMQAFFSTHNMVAMPQDIQPSGQHSQAHMDDECYDPCDRIDFGDINKYL